MTDLQDKVVEATRALMRAIERGDDPKACITDLVAAARASAIEDCAELARNRADVVEYFGGVHAHLRTLSAEIRRMI